MRIELVTIGTELLLGFTVDTNAAWIGRALAERGISVVRRATVPDDPAAIRDAVRDGLERTGFVLTTGGLGPTEDDITKAAVAALFGRRVVFDASVWADLVERYARLGRPLSDANRTQAGVPEGATVLPNPRGTAPGLWITGDNGTVAMVPGVPREMRGLLQDEVIPRLTASAGDDVIRSLTLRTAGIPESNLAADLGDAESAILPVTLAYLPDVIGVDLRLTSWNVASAVADRQLQAAAALVRSRAGKHVYGEGEADLAAVILDRLRRRGYRLAVAESCTGGLLAGRLTGVPGSSEVFVGGTIAYANQAKIDHLGVSNSDLQDHGAVSEAIALQMAAGAARNFAADIAVGVTGVAGPDGGSAEKPVGTIWLGFQSPERRWAERVVFPGNRAEIRARAVQFALYRLLQALPE
ncbi:MAG TPA: competence/damage-inducible protein A [Gemmatimonadales bacterium]|nr:competence/damage-inducible protein A [Gemmatimonadales bacterium]